MLNIDPDQICSAYLAANPAMSPNAQSGLHSILSGMAGDLDLSDPRWAAYMLATVKHECANHWQPIEELGKGAGRPYGQPTSVQDADGTTYTNVYYGRGYVQLTWKLNYAKVGQLIGFGNSLVIHPEHALEPQTAYKIMSQGMRGGLFTGKKLSDYINDQHCDYFNARRIINGVDRADLIQGYAQAFEGILSQVLKAAA
jgi:hypothetical protein